MTETEVLRRINDLDPKLIEWAEVYTKRKRKIWKAFFPVAVSFLLLVGCFFGVYYYNSNKVELDENGKIDIYTIKDAKKNAGNIFVGSIWKDDSGGEEVGEPYPKEEYLSMLKRSIETSRETFVYGTVKNIKMVGIKDRVSFERMIWEHFEDGTSIQKEKSYNYPVAWWIVTFDIDVIDDMGTLDGRETVRVVLASRYATGDTNGDINYKLKSPERLKEIVEEIQASPTGVFRLRNTTTDQEKRLDDTGVSSDGNIWKIKKKEYRVIDFADFLFWERYDCDGEKFQYASSDSYTIYLDELRVQKEE